MGLNRGFRLLKAFQWNTHRPSWQINAACRRQNPVTSLCKLIHSVKIGARGISSGKMNQESAKVRRGHLAVYVGISEEDMCRVLVPVFYFNHPLFGELLKEAEKVYGFGHPGGIQIPCRIAELEAVQMKIDVASGVRMRDNRANSAARYFLVGGCLSVFLPM